MIQRVTLCLSLICTAVLADDRFADVQISKTALSEHVYMLQGAGGNIGVSAGEDGMLIIDDQFAPLAQRISDSLASISGSPLKYVVNTHYHGDHTGGNAEFADRATIFAHDNVRKRLVSKADANQNALPVVTYQDGIKFHFNDETIKVQHLPAGHTDGDSVIWFTKANVVHMGDHFFEGRFPYIDLEGGGTVAGYMANVEKVLSMLDDKTQIIPGHGKLANKADLQTFLDMIKQTSAFVAKQKSQGASLEQMLKDDLDDKWKAWSWNFITEEKWITTLYNGQ